MEEQAETIQEAEDEQSPAFSISQADIDAILFRGTQTEDSKLRIYRHYLEDRPTEERVPFLKHEYGSGCGERTLSDGSKVWAWWDSRGIGISREVRLTSPDVRITWPRADRRIRQLVRTGQYLTEEEKTRLIEQRRAQGFTYQKGDLVYLTDGRQYEIEAVDGISVVLHDPDFPLLKRTATVLDFESQLAEDVRNFTLPPRKESEVPAHPTKRRLRTYQTFQALFPNAVVAFQEGSQYRFYGQCALDVRNALERSVYYQQQPDGEELAFTSCPVEQEEEMLRRLNQAGLYTVVAVQDAAGGPHRVKQVLNGPDPSPIRDNPLPPETQTEVPIPFPITSAEWDRILPDFKRETDGQRSVLYQNVLRPVVIDDKHGHALRRFHYEDKGMSRWVLAYTEDEALRVLEGYSLENTALTSEPLEGEGYLPAMESWMWDDVSVQEMMDEYLALKKRYPDHVIALQGKENYFVFSNSNVIAMEMKSRQLAVSLPGASTFCMTGFPVGQWVSFSHRIWGMGYNVLLMGRDEQGDLHLTKELLAKDYIPLGVRLNIDGSLYSVERVDFANDTVRLLEERDPPGSHRRMESVQIVREVWEEQQGSPENQHFWEARLREGNEELEAEPSPKPEDIVPTPIPINAKLTLEGRPFTVDSVNLDTGTVTLRDEELFASGYPIFRAEPVGYVRQLLGLDQPDPPQKEILPRDIPSEEEKTPSHTRAATPVIQGENFRITDNNLGVGGPKAKFAANIAAIQTLKRLESEDRAATPEEQDTLSRYVGWGGVQEAFDPRKENWSSEYNQLKGLLTPEEYKAARESVLNAHYTSPAVIKAIYQCLEQMGFQRGNILEPSMGVGNFFGLLPERMADSKLYGAELDSITGRIAQRLYPKAQIQVEGFEKTRWPDNFFDLAVGNVPFGQYKVSDPKYDKLKLPIHDYFFMKTIDKVRPGGVIAFISSRYTLDKKNSAMRGLIAQRCDLLGAVRLPNSAFKANAGTDVTTDILFLQKRERPLEIEPGWVQVGQTQEGLTVNQYYIDHPEMVLGTLTNDDGHRMYSDASSITCEPFPDADLSALLARAIQNIHADTSLLQPAEELTEAGEEPGVSIPADPNTRNFSYALSDGKLYYRENSLMNPVETSKTGEARVRGMIELRDTVRRVIDAQMEGCDDATLQSLQARLNTIYDRFTARYGLINSRGNEMAFADDSSYPLLCALEELDDNGALKCKADIFTKRTIRQWSPITLVDTPVEALGASIGERAAVDLTYMAGLLNRPGQEEAIARELAGVIYRDPKAGEDPLAGWQTADEYLSGNVRKKLEIARYYSEREPGRYEQNVKALEDAQPVDLEAQEIGVRLGSTWIPPSDIQDFTFELLGTPKSCQKRIQVLYSKATDMWSIEGKYADSRDSIKATVTYGTKRINAYEIIQSTLNLKDVRIFDTKIVDGNEVRVLNETETTNAQQKQTAIKAAFQDWIWRDPERRQRLTRYYNDTFNSIRPRVYDGSHIRFVGMNPEIRLEKHQSNGAARIIYGGNTLLAHCVGAGKTWTMTAAVMEMRRLGLCRKALITVPNHLTEQWGADFLRLYPAANILVATKKDFEKANRKKFCSRIATGDYDAVIIGHSQFERIPVSKELQESQLERQIDELERNIISLKQDKGENFTIKQMVYARKTLEEKLKKLNDTGRKDDVVTFEQLGVDRLFVDEADIFKNLYLYTKMRNVAGIGQTDSKRSADLYIKCQYMDMLTAPGPGQGGRGVIFGTGTPISNTMAELYTMMRYLQAHMLEEKGLSFFDAWATTFGENVAAMELKPEGKGYRIKTRFARFYNVPELMNLWREVTDIQTAEMLKLPVPAAHYHVVKTKPTDIQQNMVTELGKRADKVRSGSVDPHTDNMLSITNDGRKLALDQRLIDPRLPDDPESKVNTCVENVYAIWERTTPEKSTQLIFCDLSTPGKRRKAIPGVFRDANQSALGSGTEEVQASANEHMEPVESTDLQEYLTFCIYEDIRDKLLDRGIPLEDIAFVHDYNTDARKAELFAKVRSGTVRILLGSTQKMGAGTNVQTLLIAQHDLDIPWRPRDLEQRAGRIIRRHNMNEEVDLYRYVTEGTFDAYSYQTLEIKQRFISQLMSGKNTARTCEDIDDTALSYAEIKALCAGDPKIKLKMDLEIEVQRLNTLRAGYLSERYHMEDDLTRRFPAQISSLQNEIAASEADITTLNANTPADPDQFSMLVDGVTYQKAKEAGVALLLYSRTMEAGECAEVGVYKGFPLAIRCYPGISMDRTLYFELQVKGKQIYSVELGEDVRGNITRLDNRLKHIAEDIPDYRERIAALQTQMETIREELKRPWSLEQEWREKTARLAEVNAELSVGSSTLEVVDDTPPELPALPKRTSRPKSRGMER